jgi:hypothetical protein
VGEGALGALVGAPLAERTGAPFFLALERCEVARRSNRLSREQLYWAELEHWGADRAKAVLVAFESETDPVRRFYKAEDVRWFEPLPHVKRPSAPERLLRALGLEDPFVLVLAPELSEDDQERMLEGEFPEGIRTVALASPSGLRLRGLEGQVLLSRLPAAGPALAALLVTARSVIGLDPLDTRVLEAASLGVRVQIVDAPGSSGSSPLRVLLRSCRPLADSSQDPRPRLEDLVRRTAPAREGELASALL